jgi:hypothetical protein
MIEMNEYAKRRKRLMQQIGPSGIMMCITFFDKIVIYII